MTNEMCMWWKDETIPQLFHTDCGTLFQINGDGNTPKQLDYDYCPNCGGYIDFEHAESEDDELQEIRKLCHEYGLPEDEPNSDDNKVTLTEFIRSQFEELHYIRQQRDKWWSIAQGNTDELRQAKERIEGARAELSEAVVNGDPFAKKIDRILSPDSDEGDGE